MTRDYRPAERERPATLPRTRPTRPTQATTQHRALFLRTIAQLIAYNDIRCVPIRNARPCGQPGCTELVSGGRCRRHRRENRPSSHQRGYTRRWRKVRRLKLSIDPLCEMRTLCDGALATQVHHIDHDTSNNDLDNLESACARCHAQESSRWHHG